MIEQRVLLLQNACIWKRFKRGVTDVNGLPKCSAYENELVVGYSQAVHQYGMVGQVFGGTRDEPDGLTVFVVQYVRDDDR